MRARIRSFWLLLRGEDQRARKLRGLLQLLHPYRGKVVLMFVALLLATGASLVPPYLAGRAIDDGIRLKDADFLTVVLIAFIAAAVINWVATYAQTYLVNWVGQRALQDLRERIFSHLQRMSIGFYSRNKTGVLISRLTNDVQALDQLVTDGVVTLFSSTLTLLGTAAILLFLDAELALITFLTSPSSRSAVSRSGWPRPALTGSRARRSRRSRRTCRRRCRASGSCARSGRSRATSRSSRSSTTRTAT
jgi:ABC-type multidrug transport system fused ATPase/permease subunit